jgi:hypothetical protein
VSGVQQPLWQPLPLAQVALHTLPIPGKFSQSAFGLSQQSVSLEQAWPSLLQTCVEPVLEEVLEEVLEDVTDPELLLLELGRTQAWSTHTVSPVQSPFFWHSPLVVGPELPAPQANEATMGDSARAALTMVMGRNRCMMSLQFSMCRQLRVEVGWQAQQVSRATHVPVDSSHRSQVPQSELAAHPPVLPVPPGSRWVGVVEVRVPFQ